MVPGFPPPVLWAALPERPSSAMGLTVSDAVRILLKRVVNEQAFPLELKVPNAQTRAAMEEARAMAKARTARYDSADALIDDLEKARQQ
ncbi:DNA-damage-inducible protein J [Aerosticca soli]|uniref:DNA-damage-inducible protein J n=1 Tax=Aerosticca soli TaxID=2010829 RepID=A0A2Z6E7L8_9GAMM|nr:DNA-damage-inducible protein J [Aerosticca soli]